MNLQFSKKQQTKGSLQTFAVMAMPKRTLGDNFKFVIEKATETRQPVNIKNAAKSHFLDDGLW